MTADSRSFDSPDESRSAGNGEVQIVKVAGQSIGRARLEPGWKWSNDLKPIVGTESCQADHLGYVVSGAMHIVHEDGSEADIAPGEVYVIKPGHDAWVTGEEAFVGIEFQSKTAETFAKS